MNRNIPDKMGNIADTACCLSGVYILEKALLSQDFIKAIYKMYLCIQNSVMKLAEAQL